MPARPLDAAHEHLPSEPMRRPSTAELTRVPRLASRLVEPWGKSFSPVRRRMRRNQAILAVVLILWTLLALCGVQILHMPREVASMLWGAIGMYGIAYFLSRTGPGNAGGGLIIATMLAMPLGLIWHKGICEPHDVLMILDWGLPGLLLGGIVLPTCGVILATLLYLGGVLALPHLVQNMQPYYVRLAAALILGLGSVTIIASSLWQRDQLRCDRQNAALQAQRQVLEQTHMEVVRLSNLKDAFLSLVSHELRTPLTAIKAAASILSLQEGAVAAVDPVLFLGIIRHNSDRLCGLIDDLLDLSTLEQGKMSYHPVEGDLGRLASEVARSMLSVFVQADIRLTLDVEAVRASFDEIRLAQVLRNLLANAVKFTPRQGAVHLSVRAEEGHAVLTVEDTGIGIATDHLERIFSKFYQIDEGTARTGGGAGLGLAICRSIVEEGHGGRIWAEHAEPKGTRFIVKFPSLA